MSNRVFFLLLVGAFLFSMLLHIPANATDNMSWQPRTFAGGSAAVYDEVLLTEALYIKRGSAAPIDSFYYNTEMQELILTGEVGDLWNSKIFCDVSADFEKEE